VNAEPVTEQDLEIVHALQIAPRAAWTDAARILRITPATLAARWERLRAAGIAWVTAHPGAGTRTMLASFVELDCVPGCKPQVLEILCQDPRAVSIEELARSGDLLLTVLTRDLPSLTRFVLDDLARIGGVQRQRTHLAKQLHFEAKSWRLDALDAEQQKAFEALNRPRDDNRTVPPPRDAWPLIEALATDGRRGAADIARLTGRQPATVRRQLPRLLESGILSFRCELAQGHSRWPVNCTYFARVPPGELSRTVRALTTLSELRLCVSTTGETNLMFSVWTGEVVDLLDLEQRLSAHLPWLQIVDSAVTLRTIKRMGWMLDEYGAATGDVVVPTSLEPA
jgi:DNA-binding Lrp family transcriptional regulator